MKGCWSWNSAITEVPVEDDSTRVASLVPWKNSDESTVVDEFRFACLRKNGAHPHRDGIRIREIPGLVLWMSI